MYSNSGSITFLAKPICCCNLLVYECQGWHKLPRLRSGPLHLGPVIVCNSTKLGYLACYKVKTTDVHSGVKSSVWSRVDLSFGIFLLSTNPMRRPKPKMC